MQQNLETFSNDDQIIEVGELVSTTEGNIAICKMQIKYATLEIQEVYLANNIKIGVLDKSLGQNFDNVICI